MAPSSGATTLLREAKLVAAHVWSGQSPGQWSKSRPPSHTRMTWSPSHNPGFQNARCYHKHQTQMPLHTSTHAPAGTAISKAAWLRAALVWWERKSRHVGSGSL